MKKWIRNWIRNAFDEAFGHLTSWFGQKPLDPPQLLMG